MKKPRAGKFLLDPEQYVNDPAVMAMSSEAMGAYCRIFMRSWSMHEPGVIEPATDAVLAGLAQMDARTWRRVRESVALAFDASEPGRWIQKGLIRTREAQDSFFAEQSRKGKLGAEKRWPNDSRGHPPAIAEPSPSDSQTMASREAISGDSPLGSRFGEPESKEPPTGGWGVGRRAREATAPATGPPGGSVSANAMAVNGDHPDPEIAPVLEAQERARRRFADELRGGVS